MQPNAPAAWFSLDERAALSPTPNGCFATFQCISDRIDFAAPLNSIFNLTPSIPGFLLIPIQINSVLTQVGGVLTTTPSFSVGNDAGVQNIGGNSSLGAQFTAAFANAPAARAGSLAVNNNNQKLIDAAARIQCKIGTAATGVGLVAFGYFISTWQLIPVGQT